MKMNEYNECFEILTADKTHDKNKILKVLNICELLQFSAYEMWPRDSYEFSKFELKDIDNILKILDVKKVENQGYYSKHLLDEMLTLYNFINDERSNQKSFNDYSRFYDFLYSSLAKEIFCYRAYNKDKKDAV